MLPPSLPSPPGEVTVPGGILWKCGMCPCRASGCLLGIYSTCCLFGFSGTWSL